ncbi:putative DNA primase/helicase [Variovorax boronicumulans]|uniref:YfjI family protein n=1 Tax=Variovorax boronicumulans TaxID=436515 RepID=UPI002784A361|nr:YfjI family protein [Variovorax boronicumulans]MDP9995476.1 putative DNA primase/helicase [Variovorax boronicumulans]MDQ0007281.1 putative DNA primase/helicase [Variovorax boronicumulans]
MNAYASTERLEAVRDSINSALPLLDGWPIPAPLPEALPPVAAFDPDLLPEEIREWVMDIAHRMQAPADFAAVGAITALSSLIGARAVVQPKAKDDWRVVPNLWGLIIGSPGVMKSPALAESLRPLNKLEADAREVWEAEHEAWQLDAKVAEMQTEANAREAKGCVVKDPAKARDLLRPIELPVSPPERRFIVNDATVEKLGELMGANPWGFLAYRDEIYGLLKSMDREGQEGARAFYLQGYDGNQSYTFDRIGRGTVRVERVCLAMLGGIQPGRIQSYVRDAVSGGSGDDGLLQRFALTVWPDVSGSFKNVDVWPDTHAKQRARDVFERLAGISVEGEPTVWRFDDASQSIFNEWREEFETEIRGGDLHPALVAHLSKYRKLIPALALIFAMIDAPEAGVIEDRHLMRSLAWGDYLRTHAERLYSAAVTPETGAARSLLTKLRGGVLGASFTPREVARKCWAGLGTSEAARKAADILTDYDYLQREIVQTGGRPSEQYTVNPRVRGTA